MGSPAANSAITSQLQNDSTQRFLGESSDVRFFNAIKRTLSNHGLAKKVEDAEELESYEQCQRTSPQNSIQPAFPTKAVADNYLAMYFATIHIAYPFLCKPVFMQRYERLWDGDTELEADSSWLALLSKIWRLISSYGY